MTLYGLLAFFTIHHRPIVKNEDLSKLNIKIHSFQTAFAVIPRNK